MAANAPPANQVPGRVRQRQNMASEDDSNTDDQTTISTTNSTVQEDKEEFLFVESSHPAHVLHGLSGLRKAGTFCDVTLCVDGVEFPCHKIVLASFSPYFKAMFGVDMAESKQEKISINGVESSMIELLLDYAYTSQILITKTNVQSMLSAANLLEVLPVRDASCQFMEKNMDESNSIGIHCFAEAHACTELQEKAKAFTLKCFMDVCQQEELVTLTQQKLIEFVSDDTLGVESEEVVFNAVMRWYDHDEANRSQDFHKVRVCVCVCACTHACVCVYFMC